MVTALSAQLIRAYSHYIKGFLPFPGSVLEQPAIVLDGFDVIAQAVDRGNTDGKIQNQGHR